MSTQRMQKAICIGIIKPCLGTESQRQGRTAWLFCCMLYNAWLAEGLLRQCLLAEGVESMLREAVERRRVQVWKVAG